MPLEPPFDPGPLAWGYGSGFPKSLDVSKAIDKAAGAERGDGVPGRYAARRPREATEKVNAYHDGVGDAGSALVTAPATEEAARWQGWGTALKPAWEPIVLARKPLAGAVAANVTEHGTGAINVDGCRIGGPPPSVPQPDFSAARGRATKLDATARNGQMSEASGRWPANVTLDEGAAAMLDEQAGDASYNPPGRFGTQRGDAGGIVGYGSRKDGDGIFGYGDRGGPSRFYYTAKAASSERGEGNTHPTVKPIELMRWLVRLVTPPGGVVLDPFLGSGTTALACRREGFRCIGIEREAEYLAIIERRLADEPHTLFGDVA